MIVTLLRITAGLIAVAGIVSLTVGAAALALTRTSSRPDPVAVHVDAMTDTDIAATAEAIWQLPSLDAQTAQAVDLTRDRKE